MWSDHNPTLTAPAGTRMTKSAPCSPVKGPINTSSARPEPGKQLATGQQKDMFHVIHKVPMGDSPYVRAKHVQLVDKDPERAIALFWSAINSGDRVDSALKDMAIVMKQQGRPEEAIEAIKSLRARCSETAQESLDNVLLDLYKRCGRLDDQIALLKHKLNLIHQGLAFNGKRTKTARSQGKKFQVSIEQEATRLLGNLGWAYMQQNNYIAAEAVYRKALSIEPDNNKMCNLGICLMKQGRYTEAKAILSSVTPVGEGRWGSESHLKSYDRAQEMLREMQTGRVEASVTGGGCAPPDSPLTPRSRPERCAREEVGRSDPVVVVRHQPLGNALHGLLPVHQLDDLVAPSLADLERYTSPPLPLLEHPCHGGPLHSPASWHPMGVSASCAPLDAPHEIWYPRQPQQLPLSRALPMSYEGNRSLSPGTRRAGGAMMTPHGVPADVMPRGFPVREPLGASRHINRELPRTPPAGLRPAPRMPLTYDRTNEHFIGRPPPQVALAPPPILLRGEGNENWVGDHQNENAPGVANGVMVGDVGMVLGVAMKRNRVMVSPVKPPKEVLWGGQDEGPPGEAGEEGGFSDVLEKPPEVGGKGKERQAAGSMLEDGSRAETQETGVKGMGGAKDGSKGGRGVGKAGPATEIAVVPVAGGGGAAAAPPAAGSLSPQIAAEVKRQRRLKIFEAMTNEEAGREPGAQVRPVKASVA